MSHPENTAKKVPQTAVLCATLRACAHREGSGVLIASSALATLAVVFTMVVSLLALAAPARAEACPNEAFRTGLSAFLPDCRAYEMVSPPYKEGYGVLGIEAASLNGESVVFYSPGTFAGALLGLTGNLDGKDYIAHRGASGWATESMLPPASLTSEIADAAQEVSPSLESTVAIGVVAPNYNNAEQESIQDRLLFHSTSAPDTAANWTVSEPMLETPQKKHFSLTYEGDSANLCHLILSNGSGGEQLLTQSTEVNHLYDVSRGCDGESASVRFVGLNNAGELISPNCYEVLGLQQNDGNGITHLAQFSGFNAVPANGREVFFTASVDGCDGSHFQLFLRVGGERTLEVSRPLQPACVEVPCGGSAVAAARANSEFVGASRDGSRVFFATRASLVESDKDEGNDLYMATIGCPSGVGEACEPGETQNTHVTSLVQVSHDPHPGEAPEVQGVVSLAPDGLHAYFVARGMLSESPNAQGQAPVGGADNLYVYDIQTGRTSFIADLCSGPGRSGTAEDARCPINLKENNSEQSDTSLWGYGEQPPHGAQTAGTEGGFLVFSSFGQLTTSDTDNARDMYRYDAETGVLERVSIGEDGYDANGNCDDGEGETRCNVKAMLGGWQAKVEEEYNLRSRAISEDGSRIVFTTAEPLSPRATNGLENVYEWHQEPGQSEGSVSLISSGSGARPVEDVVISPDGKDVFLLTTQGLAAQDTDSAPDVYDARVDGGFPAVAAAPQPCSGDACQGPLTNPAPLLVPGSVFQTPGENLPVLATPTIKKVTAKKTIKCGQGFVKKKSRCTRRPKAEKPSHPDTKGRR
jgi:hypothetical protein